MKSGYHALTEMSGRHSDMLMDIGLYLFNPSESNTFVDYNKETAFLLINGPIEYHWQGQSCTAQRSCLFNEKPYCLHVPKGMEVTIKSSGAAEILIQRTENGNGFDPVLYTPDDIENKILGGGAMQDCAKRILRDIFTYENAPYSNMVMGEVISYPGRWSSYPPHHHPQPEVYYYRFDKPQGFGVSIVGDQARIVKSGDFAAIQGGLCHPQSAAPGYAMYYTWMIRHLPGNPWTDRIDDPDHAWLHQPDADIWEGIR